MKDETTIDAATREGMRVVYVAGPFTGKDGWAVACNVHRANAVAREVARLGAAPLTPHAIGADFNGTETYEFWCAATLELMRRCDAVMLTDDWTRKTPEVNRLRVTVLLRALVKGPRTTSDLRESLAARLETKGRVSDAIDRAKRLGFVRVEKRAGDFVCSLTETGITETLRVVTGQEARAST
jgi:hypothetical protein